MNNFSDNYKAIIHKDNDEIWNFYILEDTIYYDVLIHGSLIKRVKLIDNIMIYDIAVDLNDNINIICVRKNGELCYLKNCKNKWMKKIFKKFQPKSNIDFINILCINTSLHIFYSFRNNVSSKEYKIFHIYNIDKIWNYKYLTTASITKDILPYLIDYNEDGDIFLLYKTTKRDFIYTYTKKYFYKYNKWSSSIEINSSKENIDIKNFLIDSRNNLHFIYSFNKDISYSLYPFKSMDDLSKTNMLNSYIILANNSNNEFLLFESNNKLWIIEHEKNSINYMCSENFGKSWSNKKILNLKNINLFKYFNTKHDQLNILKPFLTIGKEKDGLHYLLGLDYEELNDSRMILEKCEELLITPEKNYNNGSNKEMQKSFEEPGFNDGNDYNNKTFLEKLIEYFTK